MKKLAVPIWNVVDEQAVNTLMICRPPSLLTIVFNHLVSAYPNHPAFNGGDESEIEIPPLKEEPLAKGKQKNIETSTSSNTDEEEEARREREWLSTKKKPITSLKEVPSTLQTELFHLILRSYGVNTELPTIFSNLNIQGLQIPNRFTRRLTTADSKAESLIVILGKF